VSDVEALRRVGRKLDIFEIMGKPLIRDMGQHAPLGPEEGASRSGVGLERVSPSAQVQGVLGTAAGMRKVEMKCPLLDRPYCVHTSWHLPPPCSCPDFRPDTE
jgi:hypothetical protein